MKPKQRKKTHLFFQEGRSSTETTSKNLKAFSRHTLQNSYQYLYVLPTDQEVQKNTKSYHYKISKLKIKKKGSTKIKKRKEKNKKKRLKNL